MIEHYIKFKLHLPDLSTHGHIEHYVNGTHSDKPKGRSLRLQEERTCQVGCMRLYECELKVKGGGGEEEGSIKINVTQVDLTNLSGGV